MLQSCTCMILYDLLAEMPWPYGMFKNCVAKHVVDDVCNPGVWRICAAPRRHLQSANELPDRFTLRRPRLKGKHMDMRSRPWYPAEHHKPWIEYWGKHKPNNKPSKILWFAFIGQRSFGMQLSFGIHLKTYPHNWNDGKWPPKWVVT